MGFWKWLKDSMMNLSEEAKEFIKVMALIFGGVVGIFMATVLISETVTPFLGVPIFFVLFFLLISWVIYLAEVNE